MKNKGVEEVLDKMLDMISNNEPGKSLKDRKIDQAHAEIRESVVMSEQEIANILLENGWNWDGVNRFKSAKAIHSEMRKRVGE